MNTNTVSNVFLLTAATTLLGLGVNSIGSDLLGGAVEIAFGLLAVIVYEVTPAK